MTHSHILKNHLTWQVEALDLDSLPNAGIRFMIGAGDRDGHFTINSHDGYISVNSELDRETVNLDYQFVLSWLQRAEITTKIAFNGPKEGIAHCLSIKLITLL